MTIVALEKDLFFAVKIRDTLQKLYDVRIVRTVSTLEQVLAVEETRPQLVIVNTGSQGLDWEAAIRAAHSRAVAVLAFGSHMDLEARARALQAGASKVVANSKFSRDMPGLVQRLLESGSRTAVVEEADVVNDDEE